MPTPIQIDGSLGEGGGQILRSSLALSIATRRPFTISNIRANRDKPGLLRQHLTAVQAAAKISSAQVDGDTLGSRTLTFSPGPITPGDYRFAIGSAGSATLVLQTILPPLLLAPGPSTLTLEGGTHNPHAPPYPFLEKSFLPLINRMGPTVRATLDRAGFYPAGGGRMTVSITPAAQLSPLHLTDRGDVTRRTCTAVLAGLSDDIAKRELSLVTRMMGWPPDAFQTLRLPPDQGPGNLLYIEIETPTVTEVFTGFGIRGVRAEAVADDALQQAKRYLAANVPIGPCLADQLLLPLALANGGSFITTAPTRHTRTNVQIIQTFLPGTSISVTESGRDRYVVEVGN